MISRSVRSQPPTRRAAAANREGRLTLPALCLAPSPSPLVGRVGEGVLRLCGDRLWCHLQRLLPVPPPGSNAIDGNQDGGDEQQDRDPDRDDAPHHCDLMACLAYLL